MSNNKQTSVDHLFDQLSSENLLGLFTHDQMMRAIEILDEAKAIHKEEIRTAFRIGEKFAVDYYMESELDSAEQYYYETFNTKEK